MGTHVLLESAKCYGKIKRFIHVSTDEVYGEQKMDQDGCVENSILEPTNPYAATKASAEFIAKSYYRSFQLPIIITRGNNVYGPRQYPEKVIPKFFNQLIRGKACTIHGDGKNMRNFLYVDDVVDAFDTVLHRGITGQVYNIGGNKENEISNLDVAQRLIKLLDLDSNDGSNNELIQYVENRPFNDLRYSIDSSKLHSLGWYPKVNFDEGLKRTVDWYKLYSNNWSNVESALKAHPNSLVRSGSTETHVTY